MNDPSFNWKKTAGPWICFFQGVFKWRLNRINVCHIYLHIFHRDQLDGGLEKISSLFTAISQEDFSPGGEQSPAARAGEEVDSWIHREGENPAATRDRRAKLRNETTLNFHLTVGGEQKKHGGAKWCLNLGG